MSRHGSPSPARTSNRRGQARRGKDYPIFLFGSGGPSGLYGHEENHAHWPGDHRLAAHWILPGRLSSRDDACMTTLYTSVRDGVLQAAVLSLLRRITLDAEAVPAEFESLCRGDVAVTSTTDCTLARCAALAHDGVKLIVLATLPSERQRELYLGAGAVAYLPMALEHGPLAEAIRSATSGTNGASTVRRMEVNHECIARA
jgi:hypothetical protein